MFYVAMSNHYHAGVTDTLGQLPEFLAYFHRLFAKHQNALRGRIENFWSVSQTSVVQLSGANDALRAMVYALCNPVKDHLVETAQSWPGASSYGASILGAAVRATRPSHYSQNRKGLEELVELRLTPLVGHEHLKPEEFVPLLRELLVKREQEAREERQRLGISVLGVRKVLRQRWQDRPRSPRRRKCAEQAATTSVRSTKRRLERQNDSWHHEYRLARESYLRGEDVVFPAGTYWLRRFARVKCEPMPVAP
jgi:putative transposase